MLYSRSTQYSIRALAHLATLPPHTYVPIRNLARSAQAPRPFLAKILQMLTRRGLLSSQKGPGGGVSLARNPAEIRLEDVVFAVDGVELSHRCVLGLPRCGDASPCAVHDIWKGLREALCQALHDRTLADLAPAAAPPEPGSKRARARRRRARG